MKKTYKTPISHIIYIDTTALLVGTVTMKCYEPKADQSETEGLTKYIGEEDKVW